MPSHNAALTLPALPTFVADLAAEHEALAAQAQAALKAAKREAAAEAEAAAAERRALKAAAATAAADAEQRAAEAVAAAKQAQRAAEAEAAALRDSVAELRSALEQRKQEVAQYQVRPAGLIWDGGSAAND